ncbi:5-formyltetrahydrofolate cyclo-ligase [Desulfonispora thiosulfatigenes DSM 11270]|uniref:5-formyltetrahydrofolate cyclo-ligase n=1 Tax=Desulfonispora thiosulfatigenes DSM 11270 TaxID=656914 RepID=A0A1W1VTJ2_DESTI|nr:5-formyltetrahydrofolate cyclo-ligase [Desulfonispora thiosulfatigenes]SMB96692.1 5-formyltetrahydrofolate cyclo-ligase [Desulfonispora thiosulfatigenes DSM 11270]
MKTNLRNHYKNIRNQLTTKEVEQKSLEILKILTNHYSWKNAKRLMIYMSFQKEVMTMPIIETALLEQKEVIIPISNLTNCTITPSLLTSVDELRPNRLGILELPPNKQISINPALIDLCLIPGIAFDLQGHRLGFGKGYYDRFLPLLKSSTPKIGLAFDCQISNNALPFDKHDFRMNKLCTEKMLYTIK